MLIDEGFESGEWTHDARVFPVGGEPYGKQIGEIFAPSGWTFWFVHQEGEWSQPEAGFCHLEPDPARVRTGESAYKYFGFFRKIDGGLMRRVQVPPGACVRLAAWAHAWSNSKDGPHPDDPRWSEGPGYAPGFALEGETDDDDWRNFTFRLGLDPAGGDDPFADSVVWGRGAHVYNEYAEVPPVEATAQGDAVTIFLRARTLWPFKHNDAYWDDVELRVVEEPPAPPSDGRGQPRVQYERTYVLLPPTAGSEWARALACSLWDKHRYTIGSSADDAGIGDLDVRRIVAVNPAEWGDDLAAFYREYYPGTAYAPITCTLDNVQEKLAQVYGEPPLPPPPPPPPPTPQTTPSIGPHIQTMVSGLERYARAVKPRVAKVFSLQDVRLYKQWSPETFVVFRHHRNDYDWIWHILERDGRLAAGRAWVDQFRDSLHETAMRLADMFPGQPELARFGVEGGNELVPSLNPDVVRRAAEFDIGVILALAETGLNVRAVICCAAVGNPHETEFEILLELAQVCQQHDGAFGYHTYWPGNPAEGGPDVLWRYLAGRWVEMDKLFVANGIHVKWFGGESGVVGGEWGEGAPPRRVLDRCLAAIATERETVREAVTAGTGPTGIFLPRKKALVLVNEKGSVKIDRDTPLPILARATRAARTDAPQGWVWLNPEAGWLDGSVYNGDWRRYLGDIMRMDELNAEWNAENGGRKLGDVLFTSGDVKLIGWDKFLVLEHEWLALIEAMRGRYG